MDQNNYLSFVIFEGWLGTDLHLKKRKKKTKKIMLDSKLNEGRIIIKESRAYPRRRRAEWPAATADVWLYKGLISSSVSHLYVASEAFVFLFGASILEQYWSDARWFHLILRHKFSFVVVMNCWGGRGTCDRRATSTPVTQFDLVHVQCLHDT